MGGTMAMIPKLDRICDSRALRGRIVTERRTETFEWLGAALTAVALVAIALASGLRP
jgi:hypothetical protein